jgi:hypothetical protein
MNHLHEYIDGFSVDVRLSMVSKAYANATSNRADVILEETMISEYQRTKLEARLRMVINGI